MEQSNVVFVDPQVKQILEQYWLKNAYFFIAAPLIGRPNNKYFGAEGI